MTPDTWVWVSTARAGISYHVISPTGSRTICGRYIGGLRVGSRIERVLNGHVLALADVQDRFGDRPCRTCVGDTERVDPKVGTRWTN